MDFSERKRKVEYLLRVKFPFSWAPRPLSPVGPIGQAAQDPCSADVYERVMKQIQADRASLMAKSDSELEADYANAKSVDETKAALNAQVEEESRFFNSPSAKADFVYWSKAEYWSLDESIALLLGKSPEVVNWKAIQAFVYESAFAKAYERLRNLALRSAAMNRGQSVVYPSAVLAWAKKIEIPIPSELSEVFDARAAKATSTFAEKTERKRHMGSPVVGANVRYPKPPFRVGGARWALWGQMRTAELWQAVALSLNKDPVACEELPGEGLSDPEVAEAYGGEEFFRRLLVAADALGGPLKTATATDEAAEPGRVKVDLTEFAAWAESLTWTLPKHFPRGDSLPEREPPPTVPTPKKRAHPLDALIDKARALATDSTDYLSVWASMVVMAQRHPLPPPLLGYVEREGIQYQVDESDLPQYYSKRALKERFARERRKAGAGR